MCTQLAHARFLLVSKYVHRKQGSGNITVGLGYSWLVAILVWKAATAICAALLPVSSALITGRAERDRAACSSTMHAQQRAACKLWPMLFNPVKCTLSCSANHRLDLEEVELPENHPWATRKPVSSSSSHYSGAPCLLFEHPGQHVTQHSACSVHQQMHVWQCLPAAC
jgi:hypothetical protein